MIEEMLSGFTGDDDEQAILRIFEDSSMPEREWLLKKVGKPVLEDNFHGEEFHKLEALFSGIFKAKDNKVPLDWRMEYRLAGDLRGISADPNVKKGVLLRRLAYKPVGDPQSQTVATDEELTGPPLSTTQLTKTPLEHPRDKGGDGSAEIQVGQVDKENLVVPATDVTPTTPMQYPAIDPLNKQVTATLDVTMKAEEIGDTRKTSGTRDTHATGTRNSTATAVGREDSREKSVDVARGNFATESAQLDTKNAGEKARAGKKHEQEPDRVRGKGDGNPETQRYDQIGV